MTDWTRVDLDLLGELFDAYVRSWLQLVQRRLYPSGCLAYAMTIRCALYDEQHHYALAARN